jgi:hypothetical protein
MPEGDCLAAEKLTMAAELIQKRPVAIQLRYLHTLVAILSGWRISFAKSPVAL